MTDPQAQANSRLARRLTARSHLTPAQADAALTRARRRKVSLFRLLTEANGIDESALLACASSAFGLPVVDPRGLPASPLPLPRDTAALLQRHGILPLARREQRLLAGITDPCRAAAVEAVAAQTGLDIQPVLMPNEPLQRRLAAAPETGDKTGQSTEQRTLPARPRPGIDNALPADEHQVVRFVDDLLEHAIASGASDIHIEPYEHSCRIRFRYDGLLQEVGRPPPHLVKQLVARLKVLAQLDIAQKRLPQDGRLQVASAGGQPTDFRLNTLPTLWGEKLVLRVLDTCQAALEIDRLGMDDGQQQHYLGALRRRQGLILVTGPTGSGKTVSLYTGLRVLNTPECNIATVEDPVEIHMEGINQVAVKQKQGLDFALALRAFLRQDPDVIMVGEIRDSETADIAVKAAQTGHLVLSTLHTNNASETVNRLFSMGIAGFNLASALSLVMAQRLLRRLCPHCKEKAHYPDTLLRRAGFGQRMRRKLSLYSARGCSDCHNGYRGRVGIYEVVPITSPLKRIIMTGNDPAAFAAEARRAGYGSLRHAALGKAALGITSLEEANRLT